MPKYILDTNIYISAVRDPAKAQELIEFYAAYLPFTYFHAAVAQELLLGAIDRRKRRQVEKAFIEPFQSRGRVIVPTYATWRRSGELIGLLIEAGNMRPGSVRRSFLNDAILAASCREFGLTVVTENTGDFRLLQEVERFKYVGPWPAP